MAEEIEGLVSFPTEQVIHRDTEVYLESTEM